MASRLSENPKFKVLLLEAGGDETFLSDVPMLSQYLQLSDLDWQYKTEPQDTACLAMVNHVSEQITSHNCSQVLWTTILPTSDFGDNDGQLPLSARF